MGWPLSSLYSMFYCVFTDRSKAVFLLWINHVLSGVCLLCFRVHLFIVALWLSAGKGLTS